jgi:phage tail sheath protein FI
MAVTVSYPGVYIEEVRQGSPIQGVSTSTAAFIGTAARGPKGVTIKPQPAPPVLRDPVFVQSWDAFEARFVGPGPEQPPGTLAPAVYGFFLNGGTACYIVRVSSGENASTRLDSRQTVTAPNQPEPVAIVHAVQEGAVQNLLVRVDESSRLAALLQAAGHTATTLGVDVPDTTISQMSPDRTVLTVVDSSGFQAGDRVRLSRQGVATRPQPNDPPIVVERVDSPTTVRLRAPVPGPANFGPNGNLRLADLIVGQREFRVVVPAGLRLAEALPAGTVVAISGPGGTPNPDIRVVASTSGRTVNLSEGLRRPFTLGAALPTVASLEFDLTVAVGRPEEERFTGLSTSVDHPRWWGTAVTSTVVELAEPDQPPANVDDPRPVATTYQLTGGVDDDRARAFRDLQTVPAVYDGALDLLKPLDEVSLVVMPGVTDLNAQQAMIDHCERVGERFTILDPPARLDPAGIAGHARGLRSEQGCAALYYPNLQVRDPRTGRVLLQPPSGHVAGIYARTDENPGVHKAPANAGIDGAVGLERRLTNEEQGPINLDPGVNVLRVFGGQGQPVVWGARTITTDRTWQYVNVRRLLLYLEESIRRGIQWAVFEPNDLQLWQKLRLTIGDFLNKAWRDGALFGATAEEAYFVRVDETNNPEADRVRGLLTVDVGVAPVRPAEFIVVRIGLRTDQA